MKRFFRSLLTCYLATLVLSSGVVALGKGNSTPHSMLGFEACGKKVCYLGIEPHKTTWKEAQTIFSQTPESAPDLSMRTPHQLPGNGGKMVVLISQDGRVMEISLFPQRPRMTVGQIVAHLGSPCASIPLSGHDIALRYPGASFLVSMQIEGSSRRLMPASEIFRVMLLGTGIPCGAPIDRSFGNQWRGFRSFPQ
jgi:hypothetical protein